MLSQLTALSLVGTALATPFHLNQRQSCPEVHVFGARETTAPPGYGSAGTVVDAILGANSGATSEAIDYPASGDNPPYAESVQAGTQAVSSAVSSFASQCPDTKLVLVGYSQGSEIFDNALCDGSIGNYNIVAAIWMGDPRWQAGAPYNVGTCEAGGFDARPPGETCGAFNDIIQSYCDAADPYCCTGNDAAVHQGYGSEYGSDALAFVNAQIQGATGGATQASTGETTGVEETGDCVEYVMIR